MARTKLLKAAGRFGTRYGIRIKRKIAEVESIQRKKQQCLFCNGRAVRLSKGIWQCKKCNKKFAGHAYYLERSEKLQSDKPFKESSTNKTKDKKKK